MTRNDSIDTWRYSVPSRLEREDPFEDEEEEFPPRASTRLVSSSSALLVETVV